MEPTISEFTQTEQVLAMLRNGPTCGTKFDNRNINRFGARIFDLKTKGHPIDKRPCDNEWHHHKTTQWEYFLIPADDGRLF